MSSWENYGDINFIEHGGMQIKKESDNTYTVFDLYVYVQDDDIRAAELLTVDLTDSWIDKKALEKFIGSVGSNITNEVQLVMAAVYYYGIENFSPIFYDGSHNISYLDCLKWANELGLKDCREYPEHFVEVANLNGWDVIMHDDYVSINFTTKEGKSEHFDLFGTCEDDYVTELKELIEDIEPDDPGDDPKYLESLSERYSYMSEVRDALHMLYIGLTEEKAPKIYQIPVIFNVSGTLEVEADTLIEAFKEVSCIDNLPLISGKGFNIGDRAENIKVDDSKSPYEINIQQINNKKEKSR